MNFGYATGRNLGSRQSPALVGPETTLMTAPAGTYDVWRLPFTPSIARVVRSSLNRLPVSMAFSLHGCKVTLAATMLLSKSDGYDFTAETKDTPMSNGRLVQEFPPDTLGDLAQCFWWWKGSR